jgi:hypothetical protein
VRRTLLLLLPALALAPSLVLAEETGPRILLDLETGAVWASRNTAQVPGSSGTRFTLGSGGDFALDTAPFVRARVGATLGRHALFLTFAPLRLSGDGRSDATILFRNLTFTANGDASARYRFDTYRLTYRYTLVSIPSLELALGATALLRDAEIRLSQPGQSSSERNTGFVPLLSFRIAWRLGGPFALSVDGDALAARQGRLEDVALALEMASGDLTFRGGYRLVEGGVDSSTVYNFAWLNHAVVGVSYRF